jgi:hypothetical protein
MKRLVILGEGHGETSALPVLARKILREKDSEQRLFVDDDIIRTHNPLGLVKWNRQQSQADYEEWLWYIRIAARRGNVGGILAVFDGDADKFPAGANSPFCAATAAKSMAAAAAQIGAGRNFSLTVVFACIEYESWIIAGAESLAGKSFRDGRPVLQRDVAFPADKPESHGKKWLEKNCPGYRPRRDQGPLTELLDLGVVRNKGLRSFSRLDHAIDQILEAVSRDSYIATP